MIDMIDMTFIKIFTEALRIKAKVQPDKRQGLTKVVHDIEIKKSKKEMDPLVVGYIGDIKVYKAKHAAEIRDGDSFTRDFNITNDYILTVLKKLINKPTFKPRKKTAVVYKNLKNKYDVMIVDLRGNVLTIITIIKKNKKRPYEAMQSNRQGQVDIIIEGKALVIEQEFIILIES